MTILTINILLLVFVFIGSTIAVRGDTWKDDEPRIWNRITMPGKIAILFLVISLGLGIYKETLLYKEMIRVKAGQMAEKKQNKIDIMDLNTKLKTANNALRKREVQIKDMEQRLSANINSATSGMMRVVDFPFIGGYKGDRAIIHSSRTRQQAKASTLTKIAPFMLK